MKKGTQLENFINERRDWGDKDIQLAQAFYLQQILDRAERTRSNTSTLVLVLVVIPILAFILFGAMASF